MGEVSIARTASCLVLLVGDISLNPGPFSYSTRVI